MANVKGWEIEFIASPWACSGGDFVNEELRPHYAKIKDYIASAILNPLTSSSLHQEQVGAVPNEHGGVTTLYKHIFIGTEAFGWEYFEELHEALLSVGATVERFRVYDETGQDDWIVA